MKKENIEIGKTYRLYSYKTLCKKYPKAKNILGDGFYGIERRFLSMPFVVMVCSEVHDRCLGSFIDDDGVLTTWFIIKPQHIRCLIKEDK